MSSTAEDLLLRLGGGQEEPRPKTAKGIPEKVTQADVDANDLVTRLSRVDPEFDMAGIKDSRLRIGLAAMDTAEEQEAFLTKKVGADGFRRDRFNRLALTPEALDKLGIEHKGLPVLIDEPGLSVEDFKELAADAPAIIGGVIGGTIGSAGGPFIAAELAGLGAFTGRTFGELLEEHMGFNLQSQNEVTKQALSEVPLSMVGEGASKVLGVAGRKLLAPEGKRVTQEALRLADDATKIGAKSSVAQVTKAPILGRTQNMIHRILGDPNTKRNARALSAEVERLKSSVGPSGVRKGSVGDLIVSDVRSARRGLSKWAEDAYGSLDEIVEGGARIRTTQVKEAANSLLDNFPTSTTTGKPVFVSPELVKMVDDIMSLPDDVPFAQMQRVRSRLFEAIGDNTIVPGVTGHDARVLFKSATKAFDDVIADDSIATKFRKTLRAVNKQYKREISKFDDAYIERIVRDGGRSGAIDPELIISSAFKKGRHTQLNRLFKVIPEATKKKVRRVAMEDILSNVVDQTDDPLIQVFNGKKLKGVLDSFGDDTLQAMFGPQKTRELIKFAEVTQFITQKQAMSGGLVAAGIALHPWANLGRLLQLNLFSKLLESKNGFKWLTQGISAPKTRVGSMALTRLTTQAIALRREAENEANEGQEQ